MRPLELGIVAAVGNVALIDPDLIVASVHAGIHSYRVLILERSALDLINGVAVRRAVTFYIAPPPLSAHCRVNMLGYASDARGVSLVVRMAGENLGRLILLEQGQDLAYMFAAGVAHQRNMAAQNHHLGLGYVGEVGLEPGPLVVGVSAVV